MLRRTTLLVTTALSTAGLVALPVLGTASAAPRPVPAAVVAVPVAGVDRAALRFLGGPSRRPVVLTAPDATRSFTTVGVTWAEDPRLDDVHADVRVRQGGRWSDWQHLETARDAPDGAEAAALTRGGTEPLWVGPADGVQVRVEASGPVRPRAVRVELVDPGTSPADAPRVPRAAARAAQERPGIVSREEWGADESIRRGSPSYSSTIEAGFLHHTATSGSYSAAQAASMVRSVYAYHVKSRGYADIGYNFLVDRFGRVYEGRAGGVDRPVLGAHTGGFNRDTFGVALLGDFSGAAPPAVALEAAERLLAWKLGDAYLDPRARTTLRSAGGGTSRYPAGADVEFDVVSAHRDAGRTACPGAPTYARMAEVRSGVADALGAGFVLPQAVESAEGVTVSAGVLDATEWELEVRDSRGLVVRRLSGSADAAVAATWDMRGGPLGLRVGGGRYLLRLTGTSGESTAKPWETTIDVPTRGLLRWYRR